MINYLAVTASAVLFAVPVANAQSVTGNMVVSATVGNSCTMSATPMAFNTLTPATFGFDNATAVITLACSGAGALTTVSIGPGNRAADLTGRHLLASTNVIPYLLSLTTNDTVLADNGVVNFEATSTLNAYEVTIAGRIARSPSYANGLYMDAVVLTTTYNFSS